MACGNIQPKTAFFISTIALILSTLPARHYPQFHPDLVDGIRGLFMGMFIGTMALTIWRNRRRTI